MGNTQLQQLYGFTNKPDESDLKKSELKSLHNAFLSMKKKNIEDTLKFKKKKEELIQENSKIAQELLDLNTKMYMMQKENTQLKSQNKALRDSKHKSVEFSLKLKNESNELKSEVEQLHTHMNNMKSQYELKLKEINNEKSEYDGLKEERDNAMRENVDLNVDYRNLNQEMTSVIRDMESITEQNETLKEETDSMKVKIEELVEEVNGLRACNHDLIQMNSKKDVEFSNMLRSKEIQIGQKQQDYQLLLTKYEDVQSRLDELLVPKLNIIELEKDDNSYEDDFVSFSSLLGDEHVD